MEIIKLSKGELRKSEAMAKIKSGEWTQKEAGKALGLSIRQTRRLSKKYYEKGIEGLAHASRGKPSNRRVLDNERRKVLEVIKQEDYRGFGPQLLKEQLEEKYQLKYSREWIRKLMIKEGLWIERRKKKIAIHQRRERRPQEGELVQIDGSYHAWFEDRAPKCCLINMVDDATGKIKELRFVEHESTEDYFESTKEYIKRHGLPQAMYSDRHKIFKGEKEISQFARGLKELGIELICASSPQAKGRVERAHGVLQDRLIKMMRLEKISSIEEGNKFLERFREEYNKRFGRCARDTLDRHKKLPPDVNLEKVLCIKEKRKVSKQFSLQYENRLYQLAMDGHGRRLIGKELTIYKLDNKVIIEYEGKEYKYNIFEEQPHFQATMSRKEIDAFLDKKRPKTTIEKHRKKISVNF